MNKNYALIKEAGYEIMYVIGAKERGFQPLIQVTHKVERVYVSHFISSYTLRFRENQTLNSKAKCAKPHSKLDALLSRVINEIPRLRALMEAQELAITIPQTASKASSKQRGRL